MVHHPLRQGLQLPLEGVPVRDAKGVDAHEPSEEAQDDHAANPDHKIKAALGKAASNLLSRFHLVGPGAAQKCPEPYGE